MGGTATKAIPVDMIRQMIRDFVRKARLFQSMGFDGIHLYMSYRSSILACSLSPAVNNRTDQYGGSIENRVRLSLELCKAIKWACGQDFLVEAQVSGEEEAGGYTLEDLIQYAKFWEGSIDILQIRGWDGASSHPTGYNSVKGKPMTLGFAEAIKKSGAKIVVAPNGGYHDLDACEEYIAGGKADMIAMARSFICDPEYGQKAYEGRGEDVVPCILCNKCHGPTRSGPDPTMCSGNPKLGLEDKLDRMITAPTLSKKVVVIGGDLIGAETGIYLAENGHRVTILTPVSTLAPDAPAIHYKTNLEMKYEELSNFSYITQATATGISEGKITYFDARGNEKSVQAESVVISLGRKPRKEEAMKFSAAADRFFIIGDCDSAGSIRTCNRTAFAAASQI